MSPFFFTENDINIQKRLSGDHDVDIAKAASGKRVILLFIRY